MINTYKPNDTARIEAMLFDPGNEQKAKTWAGSELHLVTEMGNAHEVKTLEGWVDLPYGHYLAKGVNDEFYPIDPDVFEQRWVKI